MIFHFGFDNSDKDYYFRTELGGAITCVLAFIMQLILDEGFWNALLLCIIVGFVYAFFAKLFGHENEANSWYASLPVTALFMVWGFSSFSNGLLAAGVILLILVIIYLAERKKYKERKEEEKEKRRIEMEIWAKEQAELEKEKAKREKEKEELAKKELARIRARISKTPYRKMKRGDCYYHYEEDGNYISHCKITKKECPYEDHADVCKHCSTFYGDGDGWSGELINCPYLKRDGYKTDGIKKLVWVHCEISSETVESEGKCLYPKCVSCSNYQSTKPKDM